MQSGISDLVEKAGLEDGMEYHSTLEFNKHALSSVFEESTRLNEKGSTLLEIAKSGNFNGRFRGQVVQNINGILLANSSSLFDDKEEQENISEDLNSGHRRKLMDALRFAGEKAENDIFIEKSGTKVSAQEVDEVHNLKFSECEQRHHSEIITMRDCPTSPNEYRISTSRSSSRENAFKEAAIGVDIRKLPQWASRVEGSTQNEKNAGKEQNEEGHSSIQFDNKEDQEEVQLQETSSFADFEYRSRKAESSTPNDSYVSFRPRPGSARSKARESPQIAPDHTKRSLSSQSNSQHYSTQDSLATSNTKAQTMLLGVRNSSRIQPSPLPMTPNVLETNQTGVSHQSTLRLTKTGSLIQRQSEVGQALQSLQTKRVVRSNALLPRKSSRIKK